MLALEISEYSGSSAGQSSPLARFERMISWHRGFGILQGWSGGPRGAQRYRVGDTPGELVEVSLVGGF